MNAITPDSYDGPQETAADRGESGLTSTNHGEPRLTAADRDLSQYTMTIEEALALFDNAGLSRNKRTVERYCEHNQIDAVKLVAAYGPTWFLNPESVEGKVKKLQQFEAIKKQRLNTETPSDSEARQTETSHDVSRTTAADPGVSRQDERASEPVSQPVVPTDAVVVLQDENKRLKQEIVDLRIDNRGLVQTVNSLVDETKEFSRERREMIAERKTFMAQIGELTTRMLQLTGRERPAPAPVHAEIIHERVIDADPHPTGAPIPEQPKVDNLGVETRGYGVE